MNALIRTTINALGGILISVFVIGDAIAQGTARIAAATLPTSRATYIGGPLPTVFAQVVNGGEIPAEECSISIQSQPNLTLRYFEVNDSDIIISPVNLPFQIDPGQQRRFLLEFQSSGALSATDIPITYACSNSEATQLPGVNSVYLSVSDQPVADIIPRPDTISRDGVARVALPGGRQAFAVAAVNVGLGGASLSGSPAPAGEAPVITVEVDSGSMRLPAELLICQTDSAGQCVTDLATRVSVAMGEQPLTFKVIVEVDDRAGIGFIPKIARAFVRFRDESGAIRGSTSVAVTAPEPEAPSCTVSAPGGHWFAGVTSDSDNQGTYAELLILEDGVGVIAFDPLLFPMRPDQNPSSSLNENAPSPNSVRRIRNFRETGNSNSRRFFTAEVSDPTVRGGWAVMSGNWIHATQLVAEVTFSGVTYRLRAVHDGRSFIPNYRSRYEPYPRIVTAWTDVRGTYNLSYEGFQSSFGRMNISVSGTYVEIEGYIYPWLDFSRIEGNFAPCGYAPGVAFRWGRITPWETGASDGREGPVFLLHHPTTLELMDVLISNEDMGVRARVLP